MPSIPRELRPDLPARRGAARGAMEMIRQLRDRRLGEDAIQVSLIDSILSGNIPDHLRRFVSISIEQEIVQRPLRGTPRGPTTGSLGPAERHSAAFLVAPDYLSVGTNDDHLRVRLTPGDAQRIADQFHCVLPTMKMVDTIFQTARRGGGALQLLPLPRRGTPGPRWMDWAERASAHRVSPSELSRRYAWRQEVPPPLASDSGRPSMSWLLLHEDLLAAQLRDARITAGTLVAGHKKDIVVTRGVWPARLSGRHPRVAIYGGLDGGIWPRQGTVGPHPCTYTDYSHGTRLVFERIVVDGVQRRYEEVLRDPGAAWMLNGLPGDRDCTIERPSYPYGRALEQLMAHRRG